MLSELKYASRSLRNPTLWAAVVLVACSTANGTQGDGDGGASATTNGGDATNGGQATAGETNMNAAGEPAIGGAPPTGGQATAGETNMNAAGEPAIGGAPPTGGQATAGETNMNVAGESATGGAAPNGAAGASGGDGGTDANGGDGAGGENALAEPPSCVGLAKNCGVSSNDDCCASPTVTGGTFTLSYGQPYNETSATIATFLLDRYEVTVGRFRKFQLAYAGHPASGAGAHPLIEGSGWQSPTWDDSSAASAATLEAGVQCSATYQTWNASGTNDRLPMNCVTWYEAFAFCGWDGGRLPTSAEWEYAAAGGADERFFPWGTPLLDDSPATAAYANYYCMGDGSAPNKCAFSDILPVGSKPAGAGKYGQLDLSGSMWEWTLDYSGDLPDPCNNCANVAVVGPSVGPGRRIRGGALNSSATHYFGESEVLALHAQDLASQPPANHSSAVGFRCARTP